MRLKMLHLDEEEVFAIVRQHLEKAHGIMTEIDPIVDFYDYGDYAEFKGMRVYYKEDRNA